MPDLHESQYSRRSRLSITIEPDLRNEVERAAEAERRSISNFVGTVLAQALEQREQRSAAA